MKTGHKPVLNEDRVFKKYKGGSGVKSLPCKCEDVNLNSQNTPGSWTL